MAAMLRWQCTLLLFYCFFLFSLADNSEQQEQEKIDLIVRSFKRLPTAEIKDIGVDLSEPVLSGSEKATLLHEAWARRQKEFRMAVDGMSKPVEHMKTIIEQIKNQSNIHALKELESMLSDVDNAKDFYTIGGWTVLVNMLQSNHTHEDRMYAAWCIGTAIKNSYDYQMWVMESNSYCLSLLVGIVCEYNSNDSSTSSTGSSSSSGSEMGEQLARKALYAIAAAARGNPDVQASLINQTCSSSRTFVDTLIHLVALNGTSIEVSRKAWALIADMLDERKFVRGGLIFKDVEASKVDQALNQIGSLLLLGDTLCYHGNSLSLAFAAAFSLGRLLDRIHDDPSSAAVPAVRATIQSVLISVNELLDQCPEALLADGKGESRSAVKILESSLRRAAASLPTTTTITATGHSEDSVNEITIDSASVLLSLSNHMNSTEMST